MVPSILFIPFSLRPGIGQQIYYQGRYDRIYFETLSETRELLIYLPQGIRRLKMESIASAVVYLLDASSRFSITSQIIKQLGVDAMPASIIIGIMNTFRTSDLNPTQIEKDNTGKPQEHMINSLGHWTLKTGGLKRSGLFYETNVIHNPESANVYDSMGDYF